MTVILLFGGPTNATLSLSGSLTPTGAAQERPGHALSGTVTPAAVIIDRAGHLLAGTMTPGGVIIDRAGHVLGGAVTPTATLTKRQYPYAQTQFPNSVVSDDNPAAGATIPWVNPAFAKTTDASYATATRTGSDSQTEYLKAQLFNFSIPSTATIVGIMATVRRHGSSAAALLEAVRLVRFGGFVGTTTRAGSGPPSVPTADADRVFGTSSDLWGDVLAPADINDVGFGIVYFSTLLPGYVLSVDSIALTVYYTLPGDLTGQPLTGAVTAAGAATERPGRMLVGAINPAGADTNRPSHFLSGLITPTGGIGSRIGRSITGSIASAGALWKQAQNHQAGGITPTGVATRTFLKQLLGSVTPTGVVVKQARKFFGGALAPFGRMFTYLFGPPSVDLVGEWDPDVDLRGEFNPDADLVGSVGP